MLTDFNRRSEFADRLETNYLRVLYYHFPDKFVGQYKFYEYNRLCTILEDEKTVCVGNEKTTFKYDKDKFLLLPPESQIGMTIEIPTKAVVFELSDDLIKNVCEKISTDYGIDYDMLAKDRPLAEAENANIKDCLARITQLLSNRNKNTEYLIDLLAQELVYYLVQIKGVNQLLHIEHNNPISKAIEYMNDDSSFQTSVKKLASRLDMSESNFSQHFKKITGVNPNEYMTKIKLEKAKDMLKRLNVTNAAYELGYENISHFITLFKNKYGVTPKQYKKMIM